MSNVEKMPKITVIQAVYGAVEGTRDVTKLMQDFVDQGKTELVADNQTLGPDPAPQKKKQFAISYMIGSTRFSLACKEDEKISLEREEPREVIKVIAATYGAVDAAHPRTMGARDVTAIVQELLDARSKEREIRFTPTDELFGDPLKNFKKSFGMTYAPKSDLSRRYVVASAQNQEVTVRL
jgi:hypothetical protein